jgi:hypothetical protein
MAEVIVFWTVFIFHSFPQVLMLCKSTKSLARDYIGDEEEGDEEESEEEEAVVVEEKKLQKEEAKVKEPSNRSSNKYPVR